VLVAKAIKGICCLIKDSGGVCSADPYLVKNCFVWDEIGYENLYQLAKSGSRVIQKEALLIAQKYNIGLKVTNLKFNTKTNVNQANTNFWSLISYQNALRVITKKASNFLEKYGFCEQDHYYEAQNIRNLQKEAEKIYQICAQHL
jgi:aspartokinase